MQKFPQLKLLLIALVLFTCAAAPADSSLLTNAVSLANMVAAPPAVQPVVLPSGLPDTGASVFRVMGALVLVIAIFLGGVWLFRNWQRLSVQKHGGAKLNLIEVKSLGQRQAIYVVGYQQQRMLLASSPAGITLLSHLPASDELETAAAPAAKMSFAEAFQHVLNRKS
jgi:flagellar biogenesis protein FliO